MDIPRNILLERLEFLETGKCYPASQHISLKSRLYASYLPVPVLSKTQGDTGHIPFAQALQLPYFPTNVGCSFGPLWTTHWFKVEFEVREEVPELHLIWDTDSEAMLYSESGTPLQAFNGGKGDDRRANCPIDSYARKYTYYIEVSCSGMFGEGVYPELDPGKMYSLKECKLGVFDRKMWDLMWDYQILIECARELKDSPRGESALYIANQVIDQFRLNPDNLDPLLQLTSEFLQAETAPAASKLLAIGHCHIDTAWLWRYQETKRKVLRSWTTQLRLIDAYPGYSFCASAALHYQWLKEASEAQFDAIRRRVEEGSWQVVGGAWVEFDGNLPGGEAMVRQLLYGQKFFKRHFGSYCKVFFLPDTFGYSCQLPQLIKKAEMPYFVTQKLSWNNINKFPHSSFSWKGLDGTSVLTHFPPAESYCSKVSIAEVVKSVSNNREKGRFDRSMMLFGLGDGGGGPLPDHLERLKRIRSLHPLPRVETDRMESLFEAMQSANLPTWYGELYFELHRGTYTTMAEVKRLNRQAESKLRQLEILNTPQKGVSQGKIEELYKVLLQNQFHDVLPGSSIEAVYMDAVSALKGLVKEVDTLLTTMSEYSQINLQSYPLEDVIQIDQNWVPVRADPFASITPFESTAPPVTVSETATGFHVENQYIKVTISDCGLIESMELKGNGRECLSGPGNQLVIYDDLPFFWDAWDLEIYHSRSKRLANQKGTLSLLVSTPTKVSLGWFSHLTPTSTIYQTFSLSSLSPHLTISSEVTWEETHKVLKSEFPTTLSPSAIANFECQFGHQTRPTHWNTTWDVAKFEVSGQRWMHLGEYNFGIGLANDSKYGMNSHDGLMALTLLRSPKAPNPNADMGTHQFQYAIYPHEGPLEGSKMWGIAAHLNSFAPLQVSEESVKWLDVSQEAVAVEAIKRAEDGNDVIIRAYEAFGGSCTATITLNPAIFGDFASAFTVNLLEETAAAVPIEGNAFTYEFHPFEIATFRLISS